MSSFRSIPVLAGVVLLSACVVAETAPPPVGGGPFLSTPPADSVRPEPLAPPEEPQLSLQERWRAPFAVASRGRLAPREERRSPMRSGETAPAPAPSPARTASAPTVEAPAPPARPPAAAEGARTHEVAWGETWYGIARRYAVSPATLAAANPGVDPERIRSGQVLRIPRAAAAAGQRTHRVQAGESLWGISRRYGIGMDEIRRANDLADDRVRIGQTLIIPQTEESR